MSLDMEYFNRLRGKIGDRLDALANAGRISREAARAQVEDYKWLYGALGEVPSRTVFICENPSVLGLQRASVNTIDGGPPDIEAQWWGGPKNPAARRFREALWQLSLKTTPPPTRGGWKCYI